MGSNGTPSTVRSTASPALLLVASYLPNWRPNPSGGQRGNSGPTILAAHGDRPSSTTLFSLPSLTASCGLASRNGGAREHRLYWLRGDQDTPYRRQWRWR